MTLDTPIILTIIGMLGAVFVTIVGCTWYLASQAGNVITSMEGLGKSLSEMSTALSVHVVESDNRDKDNREAHTLLRLADASNVETVKGINYHLERTDKDATDAKNLAVILDRRVAVLESRAS